MGRVTTELATHIATAQQRGLTEDLANRTKQHLLDGLIAVISGSTLRAGALGISYASLHGGTGESTVARGPRTTLEMAAFANAMSAHADETDDVNNRARIHPGASIVPAALAVGEAMDSSGKSLLGAISLGYDVGCAVNIGAWRTHRDMEKSARTTHAPGQTFGSVAAAASLSSLSVEQVCFALSYAAQQVGGIAAFYGDPEHVGKAFASAAMQSHAGVRSAELARMGFTGVSDIFDGTPNPFDVFGSEGDPDRMLDDLRSTRHILTTDIKQFPVGGPIQPAAEGLTRIIRTDGLRPEDVASIEVRLPRHGAYVVDNRDMPDISLQYVLSVLLLDGEVTFENSHDYVRHESAEVRAIMDRIRVVADAQLEPPSDSAARTWRGMVTVTTKDRRVFSERVDACRGSHENPMSWDELAAKAHMALKGIMPAGQIDDLTQWTRESDSAGSCRELRPFLTSSVPAMG
ncbi:MmgE/PrpD family protein [Arthrobacter gyeryongensis]|uniref:MmgE/PrpD family protein n=1 Tax=Arthrobacter gyeryongensis TaxID=1650592 RepID=A0ABP9SFB5_9MICC